MNNHQYSIKRPHLILAIVVAVLTFILLTIAAARNWFRDEPIRDFNQTEPVVETQYSTNQ